MVVVPTPVVCQVVAVLVPCAYNPKRTVPLKVVVAATEAKSGNAPEVAGP